MTPAAKHYARISVADYLSGDNDGAIRHEFVDGTLFTMARASARHNLIRSEIDSILAHHARAPCQVFSADMKLRVKTDVIERYYYPDVFVSCDPQDDDPYVRSSASLIVEILSPTTERTDRSEKFEAYKLIPSVIEYVLMSQDVMEIELFRRHSGWVPEFYRGGDVVSLESIGATVGVAAFYRRVASGMRP